MEEEDLTTDLTTGTEQLIERFEAFRESLMERVLRLDRDYLEKARENKELKKENENLKKKVKVAKMLKQQLDEMLGE